MSDLSDLTRLAELRIVPPRAREDLLDAICLRTGDLHASLRILARDVLGAGSTIDLVAADASGQVVLVMVAEADEDLASFTRAIAQRAWVAPRVRDWMQLAPDLGVRPDAPVTVSLLAPSFRPETRVAAGAFGDDAVTLSTYRWIRAGSSDAVLFERHALGRQTVAKPLHPPAAGATEPAPAAPSLDAPYRAGGSVPRRATAPRAERREAPAAEVGEAPAAEVGEAKAAEVGEAPREETATPPPPRARAAAAARAHFRTGLTDDDLNLTPQEAREFE